jgi:hypothetical protein
LARHARSLELCGADSVGGVASTADTLVTPPGSAARRPAGCGEGAATSASASAVSDGTNSPLDACSESARAVDAWRPADPRDGSSP